MKQQFIATILLELLFFLSHLHLSTTKSILNNDQYQSKQSNESNGITLANFIRMDEVMMHLNELERIAAANNGNRAVGTSGFNDTLDYLVKYLSIHTNFKITKRMFDARNYKLKNDPILISSIDGRITNYTYSEDLSVADFFRIRYSTSVKFPNFIPMTVLPNSGCSEADWVAMNPSVTRRVILLKRDECSFIEQSVMATKFNAAALLFYNDGKSSDRMSPMTINLGLNNTMPALSLSFSLGQKLLHAAQNMSQNVGILMNIELLNDQSFPVGNICADTMTGDPTQTIVIGSHSDSVSTGPGINDDGSGSAANLGWAVALARLYQTSAYEKYKYRLRFCWWGAEEIGILGSKVHVAEAKKSNIVGERLTDYVAYLNFDMLGSANFIFGIYDGRTAENDTLPSAVVGSYKISQAFRDWFIERNLPWDFVEFGYGSDYAPFLIEGVPVGGLYSGSDEIRTQEECDRYNQLLGPEHCTMANVNHDPCYHEPCDLVENINVFGYEQMIQAAASTIENLARKSDLKSWLQPWK